MGCPVDEGRIYTVGEVALMFGVDTKTVGRWELNGKLVPMGRTLGGHRRYSAAAVWHLACRTEGMRASLGGPVPGNRGGCLAADDGPLLCGGERAICCAWGRA